MATILVVDDDRPLGDMIQEFLVGTGYNVLRAENGMAALLICAESKVDLVLTDILMPDGEGTELIMNLVESHPNVKIIAMSGGGIGSAGAYLRPAKILGALQTIAKPFSQEELLTTVQAALGGPGLREK